ncbi:MAG: hypothetical protein JXQ90_05390 [Cyclobacteriaceae bacterium]
MSSNPVYQFVARSDTNKRLAPHSFLLLTITDKVELRWGKLTRLNTNQEKIRIRPGQTIRQKLFHQLLSFYEWDSNTEFKVDGFDLSGIINLDDNFYFADEIEFEVINRSNLSIYIQVSGWLL